MEATDVQSAVNFLNKCVEISLKNEKNTIVGTVYTIDPVSQNVVLLSKDQDEKPQLQIIMKQAIQDIALIDALPEDPKQVDLSLINNSTTAESHNNATIDEITEWLKRNRVGFDVKEGHIDVEGVSIYPPYRPEDCMGSNMIVLGRVQKILNDRTQ